MGIKREGGACGIAKPDTLFWSSSGHSIKPEIQGGEEYNRRYYGSLIVLQRIGEVAYKLKLPETSKIHPICPVSPLKPNVGNHVPEAGLFARFEGDLGNLLKPEAILAVREIQKQRLFV